MALDGCGFVCKYILILFNVIFAILGFVLLGLGLWLRFSNITRPIFYIDGSSTFVYAVIILILLGTVMLLLVTIGDYGPCSGKKCALQLSSVLLSILAIALVGVGVVAYAQRQKVGMWVAGFYIIIYTLFAATGDAGLGVTLLFVHEMLHCCGVTGITLLELVKETCPRPRGFFENIAMSTCPGAITDFFTSSAPRVMAIFFGTGALLFIALICSIILKAKLNESSSPSPQYIILTNASPSLPNLSQLDSDQDPIVFPPLTLANATVVQT
ncbi:CD81 antigen-like isoform X1 [Syngnathus acus]|uniref:CD81 antigen-like isoform X1 n=1 Tax=Syngnathus acus TaxID=161584 RepID=UPI001885FEBB|nr:CD81 antigen-like isoform X1 [Syngnathus acus]